MFYGRYFYKCFVESPIFWYNLSRYDRFPQLFFSKTNKWHTSIKTIKEKRLNIKIIATFKQQIKALYR